LSAVNNGGYPKSTQTDLTTKSGEDRKAAPLFQSKPATNLITGETEPKGEEDFSDVLAEKLDFHQKSLTRIVTNELLRFNQPEILLFNDLFLEFRFSRLKLPVNTLIYR
jgi:hypothetical protein